MKTNQTEQEIKGTMAYGTQNFNNPLTKSLQLIDNNNNNNKNKNKNNNIIIIYFNLTHGIRNP